MQIIDMCYFILKNLVLWINGYDAKKIEKLVPS